MLKPLAKTPDYLVEIGRAPGHGYMLTIARKTDGHCVALFGPKIGKMWREDCERYGLERALRTYLQMAIAGGWQPLYKPSAIQRMLEVTE